MVVPLHTLATARGRSIGTAVDAKCFGANLTAYNAIVAKEFDMIVAGNVMQ